MSPAAAIRVEGLRKAFASASGEVLLALDGIDLEVLEGEFVCLLGPSGCGKSTLLNAVAGFSPPTAGRVLAAGREVTAPGPERAMVFQEYALFPWMTVAQNVAFGLEVKRRPAAEVRATVDAWLGKLGLSDFRDRFPKDLSGGMRQRVAIAMALMTQPQLLVADEPTTALDVAVQARILDLLRELRMRGLAIVIVTHDLGVVAGLADRVAVMYAGRLVEVAPAGALLTAPAHPYTSALLACVPRLEDAGDERLAGIDGQPPRPGEIAAGCPFAPRCRSASEVCGEVLPALRTVGPGRAVACHAPFAAEGVA